MHFEPANKEKKKMSARVPAVLLVVWMIASTWYWMCGVKDMCQGASVTEKATTNSDQ
jgi:hypothetical protein